MTDGSPASSGTPTSPNGSSAPAPASPGGLTGDAVRSFLWAFGGFAGNRLVVFITTLVLVRILSPEEFGVVAAAIVLLGFINLVLELGLGSSLVQEQDSGFGARVDSAFTMQLVLAVLATGALVIAAPVLASALGIADDADVLRVVSLTIVIRTAGQTHDALMRRDLRFKARTLVDVSRALVRLVVSVVLAASGAGVWALVVGMLASEATATVALWLAVRYRPRLRLSSTHLVSLLRFGGAVTGIRLLDAISANADYIVIGNQLGPTALGFYVIAFRLPELLVQNPLVVFSQVAFPVLSRARTLSKEVLVSAVLRSLRVVTLFGFTIGTGLAVVSSDAIDVLFGAKWQSSAVPMAILSLSLAIGSLGYGVGDAYLALGRPMVRFWILLGLAIPMVAALVLVAPRGIIAVAWVHLGFAVADSTAQLVMSRRIIGFSWSSMASALRGPVGATVGVLVGTVPFVAATPTSLPWLLATVAVGGAGAVLGAVAADRSTPAFVRSIFGNVRARPA